MRTIVFLIAFCFFVTGCASDKVKSRPTFGLISSEIIPAAPPYPEYAVSSGSTGEGSKSVSTKEPVRVSFPVAESSSKPKSRPTSDATTVELEHMVNQQGKAVAKPTPTLVDEQLADFTLGTLGYKIPTTMKIGKPERVVISISKSQVTVANTVTKDVTVTPIKVYTYMAVKLLGDPKNFIITSISNEQQPISIDEPTQWDFDVTPQSLGKQRLTVRVSARLKVPNSPDETKDFPVYETDVYIHTDWSYIIKKFFADNWQWILSTIAGSGFLGWIYSRYNKK